MSSASGRRHAYPGRYTARPFRALPFRPRGAIFSNQVLDTEKADIAMYWCEAHTIAAKVAGPLLGRSLFSGLSIFLFRFPSVWLKASIIHHKVTNFTKFSIFERFRINLREICEFVFDPFLLLIAQVQGTPCISRRPRPTIADKGTGPFRGPSWFSVSCVLSLDLSNLPAGQLDERINYHRVTGFRYFIEKTLFNVKLCELCDFVVIQSFFLHAAQANPAQAQTALHAP